MTGSHYHKLVKSAKQPLITLSFRGRYEFSYHFRIIYFLYNLLNILLTHYEWCLKSQSWSALTDLLVIWTVEWRPGNQVCHAAGPLMPLF